MLHLHSSKAVHEICPRGGHRCSRGTYGHGERSRPPESLTGAMFSGVLAVFFFKFIGVVSFRWLLRSDSVARNFSNPSENE